MTWEKADLIGKKLKVKRIVLSHIRMRLKSAVSTSFGEISDKDCVIAELSGSSGFSGWGESPAFAAPWYSEETVETVLRAQRDFLAPLILNREIDHPVQTIDLFSPVCRNNIAKAGLECGVWDLFAKESGIALHKALGGSKNKVSAGAVIGIHSEIEKTIRAVENYLESGYKRIKLKIKPGFDLDIVIAVRTRFPELPLSVDANGAYSADDFRIFQEMSGYGLEMIEQPFAPGDLLTHARLQKTIEAPICLDESVSSLSDIENAVALGASRIFTIKMSKLGGLEAARRAHDFCAENSIPVWCGGMFETGVGRAHNIALSTLENFSFPGDISASSRYWRRDLIDPEVYVRRGEIDVPQSPGIGYEVNRERLREITVKSVEIS